MPEMPISGEAGVGTPPRNPVPPSHRVTIGVPPGFGLRIELRPPLDQPVTLSPASARVVRRELSEQARSLQHCAQRHQFLGNIPGVPHPLTPMECYHREAQRQLALRIAEIQTALAELKVEG